MTPRQGDRRIEVRRESERLPHYARLHMDLALIHAYHAGDVLPPLVHHAVAEYLAAESAVHEVEG